MHYSFYVGVIKNKNLLWETEEMLLGTECKL